MSHIRQVSKLGRDASGEPVEVNLEPGHIGKASKLLRDLTCQGIVVHQTGDSQTSSLIRWIRACRYL